MQISGHMRGHQLIETNEAAKGVEIARRLRYCGGLDLTVEASALREPWRRLFTEVELEKARQRLDQSNYNPELQSGWWSPGRGRRLAQFFQNN
jgi:hypothetical protein